MKRFLFLLLLGLISIEISAKNIRLSGKVVDDETGESLPFSTLKIVNNTDSLIFAALIDSDDASFRFDKVNIESGEYRIIITYGFNHKKIISIDGEKIPRHLDLGVIRLKGEALNIKETKIIASGKVERLVGKEVYSIDSTLLTGVVQTADLLNKIPLIRTDPYGQTASILGKANTLITVNGINLGYSTDLRRVNYRDIEKIEVITMPSGDINQNYNAVINIVTKKEIRTGVETGFQEMLRIPSWDSDFYTGFGYGSEKMKVEFIYFNYYRNSKSIVNKQRIDNESGQTYNMDGRSEKGKELDHTFNVNLDWHITKNDYFNITTKTELSGADKINIYNQFYTNAEGDTTSLLSPFSQQFKHNYFIGNYTLHYKHTMKDKETDYISVTSNIGYTDNEDGTKSVYEIDGREVVSTETGNRFSANIILNYNNIISDVVTFTAGLQGYYRNLNSKINNEQNTLNNYTNYLYNGYADINVDFGKWGFKIGLKGEGNSNLFHNMNSNSQFSFQPYAGTVFRFDGKNSISFDYKRNTYYPTAWLLVPYTIVYDDKTSWKGNPDLKPYIMNSFDVRYSYKGKMVKFVTGPTYYHGKNVFSTGYFHDSELNQTQMPVNCGNLDRFGYLLTGTFSPWEWLDINPGIVLYYDIYNTFEQRRENFAYDLSCDISLYLPFDMMLYTSASYTSTMYTITGYREPVYNISTVNLKKYFRKIGMSLTLSYWQPLTSPSISHYLSNIYENINYSYRTNSAGVMVRLDYYFMSKKRLERSNVKTYYDTSTRSR